MFAPQLRASALVSAAAMALFLAAGTAAPSTAHAQTLNDPTIVAIFDAANTADIETGQLAVDRGQSKAVRDFGAMMVRDHDMVRQMGRDLAAKLKVTPTPPRPDQAAVDHAATMKRLRGLSNANFDRAYLEHEIAFHKAVLDAMHGTLMPAIQNAELKALVEKVAPAFQGHMLGAQTILERMAK